MKFLFAAEDTIVGIVCGLLLIGYAGRYFSLILPGWAYTIAFVLYLIVLVFDIFNELSDLSGHTLYFVISFLHTAVDILIALAFLSKFSGWTIPWITAYLGAYTVSLDITFWAGVVLIAGGTAWLIAYPFLD